MKGLLLTLLVFLPGLFNIYAQFETPLADNALVFNGVSKLAANSHVQFTNGLFETEETTVEMWIRTTAPTGNNRCVYSAKTAEGNTRMSLHVSSEGRIGIWNGEGWQYINTLVAFDTWIHLAFSISTTSTTVYTNGVQRGVIPLSMRTSVTNTIPRIGATGDYSSSENWRGGIDEIRIWGEARNATQVAADMNDRSTTNTTNLLGYYDCNQGMAGGYNKSITMLVDRTPAQRNGRLINFRRAPYTYSNFVANKSGALVEPFTGLRIFVNGASANGGNGSSWQTPCTSVADALEVAGLASQDLTINVAKGIYKPGNDPSETFLVSRPGIGLYGGFNGIDTNPSLRDPKLNETILSGEIGSPASLEDNSIHVLAYVSNVANKPGVNALDGFTIRDGYAGGEVITVNGINLNGRSGAAIYVRARAQGYSCTPLLNNCLILDNTATGDENNPQDPQTGGFGAAVRIDASDGGAALVQFQNTVFSGTKGNSVNGAVLSVLSKNGQSEAIISNCVFTANMGGNDLIYHDAVNARSILNFTNNTVFGNEAVNFIHTYSFGLDGKITLTNNIILNGASQLLDEGNFPNDPLRNFELKYNIVEFPLNGNGNIQTNRFDFFRNASDPIGKDGIWRTADDGFNLKACGAALDSGLNGNSGMVDITGAPRVNQLAIDRGAYEGVPTAVVLSTPASNNTPFVAEGCEGDVFTPYAIPGQPGNLSIAIAWGQNNSARNSAEVTVNTEATNNVVTGTGTGTVAMRRYWNVNLNGAPLSEPVRLRYYYDAADTAAMKAALSSVGGVSEIRWVKTSGAPYTPSLITPATVHDAGFTWLTPSAKGVENGISYVEFSGITSFSGGGAVAVAGSALPVRVTAFQAKDDNCSVKLDWSVADAVNFKGYEIERSAHGVAYTKIGTVAHASGKNNYSFADASVSGSGKYNYRLKLADIDGKFVYSDVLSVESACNATLDNISIAPNPVRSELTINFNSDAKNAVVNVRTLAGTLISSTKVANLVKTVKIPVSSLQAGVYIVELNTQAGKIITQKIIKQ